MKKIKDKNRGQWEGNGEQTWRVLDEKWELMEEKRKIWQKLGSEDVYKCDEEGV